MNISFHNVVFHLLSTMTCFVYYAVLTHVFSPPLIPVSTFCPSFLFSLIYSVLSILSVLNSAPPFLSLLSPIPHRSCPSSVIYNWSCPNVLYFLFFSTLPFPSFQFYYPALFFFFPQFLCSALSFPSVLYLVLSFSFSTVTLPFPSF
jgi:hypothetical protein